MNEQHVPNSQYLTVDAARQLYQTGDAAHDFDHVWRVTRLAVQLAAAEGADAEVVTVAALLHDVPVEHEAFRRQHAIEAFRRQHATAVRRAHHLAAAAFARDYLMERGMPEVQVANVVHAIEAHRFRDQSIQPESLEAQCLYDADKLDSMGAIGVARAFAYAGSHDSRLYTTAWRAVPPAAAKPTGSDYTPVHEFVYKLQQLLTTLHTATARQIGQQRHQFMVEFFEQLDAEMRL